MGDLWLDGDDRVWCPHPLDADVMTLTADGPMRIGTRESIQRNSAPLIVRARSPRGRVRWVLLIGPTHAAMLINGQRVPIGARVLSNRDAIAVGHGRTAFFSSEQRAQIEAFPDGDARAFCIRCKLPLERGTPAVRCPSPECGFWHHQSDELPCWLYTAQCAACGYPTPLDSGLQWSPAEL